MRYRIFLPGVVLILAACGTMEGTVRQTANRLGATTTAETCSEFANRLDGYIQAQHAGNAQTARIAEFPYFRVNRLLASFREELQTRAAAEFWVKRLRKLDQRFRTVEIRNLTLDQADYRNLGVAGTDGLFARLEACGEAAFESVLADQAAMERLAATAVVPDQYSEFLRLIGLYPLTRLPVAAGVARLHTDMRSAFRLFQEDSSYNGKLYTYKKVGTLSREAIASVITRHADNPLGIPQISESDQERLFRHFAPVWSIEQASDDDFPGVIYWQTADRVSVDTSRPAVYRHLSYTRFAGRVLPQLNYIIWFPARTASGPLDLLAGHLDGINWRVTLQWDGTVLMYDTIHNCGCYHMVFPSRTLERRPPPEGFHEPLLLPARAPAGKDARLLIHVAAGTHYIEGLGRGDRQETGEPYTLLPYLDLAVLPQPDGGHRSIFNEDGVVPGTGRLEKWLLWPMGVVNPGAMKQWGHHAVAFTSRRHFDDPFLISDYFAQQ